MIAKIWRLIANRVLPCVIVFIAFTLQAELAFSKTGSVSITSPANNSSFSGNTFTASVSAPLSWTNGVLDNGTCSTYNAPGCTYWTFQPKLDFFYNGSKYVVGKLVYSIDGGAPVTVQDMLSDVVAKFSVPINIGSLTTGNHSITFSSKDVYSTMSQCYYSKYNGSCMTGCGSCHDNPNVSISGPWQRQDGSTIASATLNFTVDHSITSAPPWVSPSDKRFFTGSTSTANVSFAWPSVPNATSYKLDILDAITGSLIQEGTPAATAFSTSSLQPLKRYSWKVAGSNSVTPTGPFSELRKFIIGPNMECWPEIGSGNSNDIDTCYDLGSSTESYLLKDISRRANMNVAGRNGTGHNGNMSDSASIITQQYPNTFGPMADPDNNWVDSGQTPGVDAHVDAGVVYDYLNVKFYLNPVSTINIVLQNSMATIVQSQAIDNCDSSYWDPSVPTPTVTYCAGSPYNSTISLGRLAHEWTHVVTGRASDRGYNQYLGLSGEAGTMNEAFSDWMAAAVKQANPANGDNGWVFTSLDSYTRNLSNPLLSNPPQPIWYGGLNWKDCGPSYPNNCGIHQNTGVPNKMFYLLSMGGEGVQAVGIEKAIQIAYKANTNFWEGNLPGKPFTLVKARDGMIKAAQELFGNISTEADQVDKAWAAVGVTATSTPESLNAKKAMPAILHFLLDL